MRAEAESKKVRGRPIVRTSAPRQVTDRGRISSRKYGRAAADALSEPRCGMRCPDEPQLEQDKGHDQDGDTADIATALYQQLGLRGLARREVCRHLGISLIPRRWKGSLRRDVALTRWHIAMPPALALVAELEISWRFPSTGVWLPIAAAARAPS
jgi:hypothetical protein